MVGENRIGDLSGMKQDNTEDNARVVYFSHGGGPLPILGDASHKAMIDFMKQLPSRLRKPEAILVISSHWEESTATLLGAGEYFLNSME